MGLLRKIIITGLLAGIFGLLLVFGFLKVNQPVGTSSPVQIVHIPSGTGFTQVSDLLHQKGLLKYEWFFQVLGRVQRVDRKIIPGEYELHAGMRPTELLAKSIASCIKRTEPSQLAKCAPPGWALLNPSVHVL